MVASACWRNFLSNRPNRTIFIVRSVTYFASINFVHAILTVRCPKLNKLKPKSNPKQTLCCFKFWSAESYPHSLTCLALNLLVKGINRYPVITKWCCDNPSFNDPCEHLILCSCGHSCLRVWVGGFVLMVCHGQFSSLPKLCPTQNCPWGGEREQSSWNSNSHYPKWIWIVARMDVTKTDLWTPRSPWVKANFGPQTMRSKKAKESIIRNCKGFRIHVCDLFQSFCMSIFIRAVSWFVCWLLLGLGFLSLLFVWGFLSV